MPCIFSAGGSKNGPGEFVWVTRCDRGANGWAKGAEGRTRHTSLGPRSQHKLWGHHFRGSNIHSPLQPKVQGTTIVTFTEPLDAPKSLHQNYPCFQGSSRRKRLPDQVTDAVRQRLGSLASQHTCSSGTQGDRQVLCAPGALQLNPFFANAPFIKDWGGKARGHVRGAPELCLQKLPCGENAHKLCLIP